MIKSLMAGVLALGMGLAGSGMAGSALAATPPQVERLANLWVGSWSNERQALANGLPGEPAFPESVRLKRDLKVYRIDAPAIGPLVLMLVEIKSDKPTLANRQRVMTFQWDEASQKLRVEQLFFATTLTYDQHIIPVADIARMKRSDFTRQPGCDLYLAWDATLNRFTGGMAPRACAYVHPVSGPVYAEYNMILDADRLWYRDRSIKTADGSIRGEIDGFSWLAFDRLSSQPELANGDRISKAQMLKAMGSAARMEGTWEGTFRRYDAEGVLVDALPSKITVEYLPDGQAYDYHQINILAPVGKPEQRIESYGKWDIDRLRFSNPRLDGWIADLSQDPQGLTSALSMTYKDGSGMIVSEIIHLSADARSRQRATQYIKDGKIVRRTLIDEVKTAGP